VLRKKGESLGTVEAADADEAPAVRREAEEERGR
jgi:hypothetical protein